MANSLRRSVSWPFGFAVFLAAWLIFQIQPMMSKLILPWFGGSPQVWTVCLLFFQTLLFAGYLFAHALQRWCSARWQAVIYIGLLTIAIVISPVVPSPEWKPHDGSDPTFRILLLLLRFIGLPYFLLSVTGPLLQVWHHRVRTAESPYWLYALSNAGSLLGLLAYPFGIDILLSSRAQSRFWIGCYVAYIVTAVACAILLVREGASDKVTQPVGTTRISSRDRMFWFGLAMIPSLLLAAVTNKLSIDVSPVPFLWVIPLTLYLVTFIVCFAGERWCSRLVWGLLFATTSAATCVILVKGEGRGDYGSLPVQFAIYLGLLLSTCMVCHGELVRLKPSQDRLTEFYLFLSAGGAAGGLFAGLVAPRLFPFLAELHIAMLGGYVVLMIVCFRDLQTRRSSLRGTIQTGLVLGFAGLLAGLGTDIWMTYHYAYQVTRNFYGVLRIVERYKDVPNGHVLELGHGGTRHGKQYVHPSLCRLPTTYYGATSGVGLAMRVHHPERPRRIGVVGLGVGTLATYGKKGDAFDFFEINPDVVDYAQNFFRYLSDSNAAIKIIPGDARISLERMKPRGYDILVLDAFSSDVVPLHLLTKEAFEIDLKHLSGDGIIALHVSSRYFDLLPVAAGHAQSFGLAMAPIFDDGDSKQGTEASLWILLARDAATLNRGELGQKPRRPIPSELHWTDAHSSLFAILKWN